MRHSIKEATRAAAVLGLGICAFAAPLRAQPSWIMPDILAAARAEGELTIYASMNEEEALPYWRVFETATGRTAFMVAEARMGWANHNETLVRTTGQTQGLKVKTPVKTGGSPLQ